MLILTSFSDHDIDDPEYKIYSISDKQPNDLDLSIVKYNRLNVFVPSSDLLGLNNEVFADKYLKELENKQVEIKKVIREMFFSSDSCIVLCCWCNENFKKEESLFCHRIVIKTFMNKYFPYIKVELRGFENDE